MARYTLQLTDGQTLQASEPREVHTIEDARLEAVVYAAEMLGRRPETVWTGHDLAIQLLDDCGDLVCTVTISARTAT